MLYDGTRLLGGGWIAETVRRPRASWMPPPLSAGILLFRQRGGETEVLLIKPGGPYWRNKDAGAWMIPKGMVEPGETPAEAALREFAEETGTRADCGAVPACDGPPGGGKMVEAFAVEGDLDAAAIRRNEFEVEWPPRSGTAASAFPKSSKRAG